jgi:ADP-ribosylglycohydrolase
LITLRDRYRGCLLGGAVGDALGAGIEFWSLADIRAQHGPGGLTGYVPCYGRPNAITDDTQMTLFTAEGLLRAYQRWLVTQDAGPARSSWPDGWLISQDFLHHERSPG